MKRIKFYSPNDMSNGYYLRESEKLIKQYKSGEKDQNIQDINDIIELYNVKKYFDNKIYLTEWTPDDIKCYEDLLKHFLGTIAKYFKSITNETFDTNYNQVDIHYKNEFWELIEKFRVYEHFSTEKFQDFLNVSKVPLRILLTHKNITKYFGSIIRHYMLNNYSSAELLLDEYEMKHIRAREPLHFPKELNNADKEAILCNYIDSENPNLNYLRLISTIQSTKDKLEISPKTLLKSKRKAEEQEKQLFHENSGIFMETTIAFSKSQEEEVVIKTEDKAISVTYSKKWIENNKDYATLLNNFIYLFEFTDLQMRCTFVNKFNEMSVIERFLIMSSENAYMKGVAFDQNNIMSLLQMTGYYHELFSVGIRLEEVIEWFFEEYLLTEFNAHDFKVTMPSSNSTLLEKCTNIMPAMESVLKQFSLFVQEGQIDFELLEIRSEHLIYKNIPSLVNKKYAYGVNDEYQTATFLLFSDQSHLGYNEKSEKSYRNFFELLNNENFKLNDFPDYNKSEINWLIDRKYLSIDSQEFIVFNNNLIMILKDLHFNEVISYWKYSTFGRKIIDELEKKNVIEFESSLFSRPEYSYINYFLNKSQFNNGLDLRNKYSHTQPNCDHNDKIHNQNYMIFLRLFILTIIKINDDFCISNEFKNEESV